MTIIAVMLILFLLVKVFLICSKTLLLASKISPVGGKGVKGSAIIVSKLLMSCSNIFKITNICISVVVSYVLVYVVAFLIIVALSVSSFLVLFTSSTEDGGYGFNKDIIATLGTGKSATIVGSSEGDSKTSSSVGKPEGLSQASWDEADDVAKQIISFACKAITEPPNGKPLLYQQGDTPVGYVDCSVFVCAVLEGATHKTFGGLDSPGYDFAVNRKSDLTQYMYTGAMLAQLGNKPEANIGQCTLNNIKPGDILVNGGHVVIYLGKNETGLDVIVHSSMSGGNCSDNILLVGGGNDTGFSTLYNTDFTVVRPSLLIK